jgi:hypothetical protein
MLNFGLYRVLCMKVRGTDKWWDTDVDGSIIKIDPHEVGCEDVHLVCPMQDKGQWR